MHCGEIREARDRRHLEVAEVSGQNQDAFASIERACKGLDILQSHRCRTARRRQPAKAQKLPEQAPQVGVVCLRQALDLGRRRRGAEYPAQIVEDHRLAQGQEVIQHLPRERHFGVRRNRQHDRRRAAAVVGQRYDNGANAMPVEQRLRSRSAYDLRSAIGIARHGEIRRLDLPQRKLAWKELDASFLRRKPRGKARGAPGAFAAVDELLRGKNLAQRFGRRLDKQPLDARDLDAVDAASVGCLRGCWVGCLPRGALGVGGLRRAFRFD